MEAEDRSLSDVLDKLKQQEQQESLEYLVERLPALVSSLQLAEDRLAFITSTMQDTASLQVIMNQAEDSADRLHLDETHARAMLDLVHVLPRLVPLIKQMEDMITFVESVSTDERTVAQLMKSTTETLNAYLPLTEGQRVLEETNEEFLQQRDDRRVSLLDTLRMFRDPVVQDGLKYVQTLLAVLNRRA